ncbi:hypothetical protein DFH08DRAFT_963754 [Mycena albidolilacea]|uniref:Uncharacterized protein n=1 Tax=Mycena albidolilacea TaxID=1033008 RepID=A0AAD6ZTY8_9AGAR|nr:hypothetical protein DFH08DRAFT_963754 [Mycena albidolilacea]
MPATSAILILTCSHSCFPPTSFSKPIVLEHISHLLYHPLCFWKGTEPHPLPGSTEYDMVLPFKLDPDLVSGDRDVPCALQAEEDMVHLGDGAGLAQGHGAAARDEEHQAHFHCV